MMSHIWLFHQKAVTNRGHLTQKHFQTVKNIYHAPFNRQVIRINHSTKNKVLLKISSVNVAKSAVKSEFD